MTGRLDSACEVRSAAWAARLQQTIRNDEMTGQSGATPYQVGVQSLDGCQIAHAGADDLAFAALPIFGQVFAETDDSDIPTFKAPDLPHCENRRP
jgi:hypothetical protein